MVRALLLRALLLLAAALALALAVLAVAAAPASASVLAADSTQNVTLSVPWSALVVSQVIPLAVALITAANASSAVKATANLLLSATAAALTVLVDNGGSVPLVEFVGAFFVVLTASQVGHRVVWSHAAEPGIRSAVPGGIGGG